MRDWLETLHRALEAHPRPIVRVVVATVRGSAPREAGASMLVGSTEQHGTIGGGHLEFVALEAARNLLQARESSRLDRFSLGASLGQCCGGIVELWFQRYDAGDIAFLEQALDARRRDAKVVLATRLDTGAPERHRLLCGVDESDGRAVLVREGGSVTLHERIDYPTTPLWLFGAGHVGQALVGMLAALPFHVTWVDTREGRWPEAPAENVRTLHTPDPAGEVRDMPAGAWALVMTHSHVEDFDICRALLGRGDLGWIGLIGSAPKAARFRQRLRQRGVSDADIARLVTPIGIPGIASKEPAAIAVAVAAQLLQLREAHASKAESVNGLRARKS